METIGWGFKEFQVPGGYRRVEWNSVVKGEEVWTVGMSNGIPCSYGPFEVEDPINKRLKTIKEGRVFTEKSDALIRPIIV